MKLTTSARLDAHASPTDHVAAADARDYLATYLSQMEPMHREALEAMGREESLSDYARRQGISAAAAHYRRDTAMRRFRQLADIDSADSEN